MVPYVPTRIRVQGRETDTGGLKGGAETEGRGWPGGIGYVLSACIPIYSSYCITGLALLPPSSCTMRSHPIVHIQYPSTPWLHFATRTFPEHATAIPLTVRFFIEGGYFDEGVRYENRT